MREKIVREEETKGDRKKIERYRKSKKEREREKTKKTKLVDGRW